MIEPDELRQVDPTHVLSHRRRLIFFAGCDYYRLSWNPRVRRALVAGMEEDGLSVAASRLTTGNHPRYRMAEKALAALFKAPAATIVSTGYFSDLVAAEALAGEFSHVVMDSAAHPALKRAADILQCPIMQFESRNVAECAKTLKRCGAGAKPILLTEGMFARDGSVAPLKHYLRLLPKGGIILVDDAHGAGVVGLTGRGTLEYCGVGYSRIVQTVTLSKAFGVYGGAILGSSSLRDRIIRRSSMFVGSTPLPLPLVNAVQESVGLLASDGASLRRMKSNIGLLRAGLRARGIPVPENPGPILAMKPASAKVSRNVRKALLDEGVYPSLIRYPGIPNSGYYRFVVSSEHSPKEMDALLRALRNFNGSELIPV